MYKSRKKKHQNVKELKKKKSLHKISKRDLKTIWRQNNSKTTRKNVANSHSKEQNYRLGFLAGLKLENSQ